MSALHTLQFVKPTTARLKQYDQPDELLFPSGSWFVLSLQQKRLLGGASAYRNVLAWYLRAADISSKEIANHLSISRSRANAIALKTQKAFYNGPWTIAAMEGYASTNALQNNQLQAHMVVARRVEMNAAESILDRCLHADWFAVSASLRIGRAAFQAALDSLGGEKCNCRMCVLNQE